MIVESGHPVLNAALKELHEFYNAETNREQAESIKSITQPLYHYTDTQSFESIVGNETFWLFDYRHLADSQEVRHGLNIAISLLRELRSSPLSERTRRRAFALDRLGRGTERLTQEATLNRLFEVFIGCFTRHVDDLDHWKAFGRGCTGIAFGVSPRFFIHDPRVPVPIDPVEKVFAHPVNYGTPLGRRRQSGVINTAKSILMRREVYEALNEDNHQKFFGALCTTVTGELLWNSIMGKRQTFAQEREVRVMVTGSIESLSDEVRVTPSGRRYVAPELPFKSKPLLTDVVIGALAPANTESRVAAALSSARLESVPVRRTKTC